MKILRSNEDLRLWRQEVQTELPRGRISFVPTMGALHDGHAELLRRGKDRADRLLLSIFVNPTQFGPNEDFAKYPRTLESDCEIAKREGVDAVFVPTEEMMYPSGFSTDGYENEYMKGLCGPFRPGHFPGVTTVVSKLFHLVKPTAAVFGLKDVQQFFVLKKMVSDLDLNIEMIGVPTVREADGLALSSRNRYLLPGEREKAPLIYKTLLYVCEKWKEGQNLLSRASETLETSGFRIQYFEHARFGDDEVIATAAYLGSTRLIDNVSLKSPDS